MHRSTLPLLLMMTGCPWDPPVSDNPLSAPPLLNTIEGTVVFAGNTSPGATFVTVYDAADPGPPAGTGGPVTFSTVARGEYTGDAAGLQSAPYSVSQLADGEYLVNALVDKDGDFSPLSSALAGATCGDWGGAHVSDLVTLQPAPVTVAGGQVTDDVTVLVGQAFTTERPAFTFLGGPPTVSKQAAASPVPPIYRLQATGIHAAFGEALTLQLDDACLPDGDLPDGACEVSAACPCEIEGLPACATALWVWMVDADADGVLDPYPDDLQAAEGLRDVWPRVFLESLDDELGTFEHQGETLPERWVAESYPLASAIAIAELSGGSAADLGPVGIPFPALQLEVTASPVFRHYHADGQAGVDTNGPFDVLDLRQGGSELVPEGAWSATLVSFTGQTWTLPNEIGLVPLPPTDPGFDPEPQGHVLLLAP